MLVLQRRVGEAIVIGEIVQVKISSIRGRYIRVAIDAPRDIPIRRAELEPIVCQRAGSQVDRLQSIRQFVSSYELVSNGNATLSGNFNEL